MKMMTFAAAAVRNFAVCLVAAAAMVAGAADTVAYRTQDGVLEKGLSHVQGVCFDGEHYYLSQDGAILKCDRRGALVKKTSAIVHTGDLAFRDGKIYAAVAVSRGELAGKGIIHVYDTDLKLVKERVYERGFDGIELLGDSLYVGRGSHLETIPVKPGEKPHSSMPHRENEVWILDPATLDVRSKHVIDYGYRTTYATQNIATDGKYLYFAFYVADRKDPGIAVYDDKLEFVRVINAHAANGLVYDPTDHTLLKFRTRGGFADAVKIDIGDRPMRTEANSPVVREETVEGDFVVAGGGLSGLCAAVAAARHGAKVVLVQDRPMLGGNASSEMRMGIMGVQNADWKEAGLLEELQLMNFHYNPLMRYTLWDDVMLSLVRAERNITLLLNTSVDGVEMEDGRIVALKAWNGNAYVRSTIRGRLFADCTGDGILRLSGAKFRIGRELPEEFGEDYLQSGGDHRTMGNSILLQLRKQARRGAFVAPPWAYKFTDDDFRGAERPETGNRSYSYRRLYPDNQNFWWIEFGGNLDTIGDANAIQFELKKIAYGVWEYMKNHPDRRCDGYELDWIGALPGKRESTRFVGPRILTQHDLMSGGRFDDVVAYGGWTMDDHHPDAFWKKGYVSQHHGVPAPYGIPFDCLYSVNVPNLMFAGRDISVTHIALSSTRVMGTCALLGQAVGTAAAVALRHGETPAELRKRHIGEVQDLLEDDDCLLPGRWRKVSKLTREARTAATNEVLRSGIDRAFAGKDNGLLLPIGEPVVYEWDSPRTLKGARLVFDSQMNPWLKRMRKLEAVQEGVQMPWPLAKAFRLEARVDGAWTTVFEDKENFLRLRKVAFKPVAADALRLVVTATWHPKNAWPAHVFAFDAL